MSVRLAAIAQRVCTAAVVTLIVSGALAALWALPSGKYLRADPAAAAVDVRLSRAARAVHVGAAGALVASGAVLTLSVARGRRGRRGPALAAALVGACLATGLAIPWTALAPWGPAIGPNLARPAPVADGQGPFPELVAVNLRYGDGLPVGGRLDRWRLGPRGVRRLWIAHVVVLPLVGLAGVLAGRRRQAARSPADADGGNVK